MNTSQKGIDLIKIFEGLRLTAYKPVSTEKYWTIGYGHYGPDVFKNMTITKERAEDLLKQDLKKFEAVVDKLSNLTQNQFDALVSICYNIGTTNFLKSTLYRKVKANPKDKTIPDEFRKWKLAGGKVLPGLVKRRDLEAKLYISKD